MLSLLDHTWKRPIKSMRIGGCVAAMGLLASCGGEKNGVNAKAGSTGPAVSVVVAPVVQKTVPIFTELTARIDATDSVDIRARVKAFLLKQSYDEGKMVKAGQVLFTLDKREYEAQLMQAKAQLAKAQADLTQAQDRTVVDVAQANLQIAMAQLNKTNQDVNRLKPLAELRAVPQQDYDDALAAQQAANGRREGKQASLNTTKVNQVGRYPAGAGGCGSGECRHSRGRAERGVLHHHEPHRWHRRYAPSGPRQSRRAGRCHATHDGFQCRSGPGLREYQRERVPCVYQRMKAQGKLKDRGGELELILADGSTFPGKGRIIIADRAVDLKTGTLSIVAEFPNPRGLAEAGAVRPCPDGCHCGRKRSAGATEGGHGNAERQGRLCGRSRTTKWRSAALRLGPRVGSDYIVTEGVKAASGSSWRAFRRSAPATR